MFDALFTIDEFLGVVERLDGAGGLVRQFAKPPSDHLNLDDPRCGPADDPCRALPKSGRLTPGGAGPNRCYCIHDQLRSPDLSDYHR